MTVNDKQCQCVKVLHSLTCLDCNAFSHDRFPACFRFVSRCFFFLSGLNFILYGEGTKLALLQLCHLLQCFLCSLVTSLQEGVDLSIEPGIYLAVIQLQSASPLSL